MPKHEQNMNKMLSIRIHTVKTNKHELTNKSQELLNSPKEDDSDNSVRKTAIKKTEAVEQQP